MIFLNDNVVKKCLNQNGFLVGNIIVIAEIHALKFYKGNCSVSFSFLFVVKMSTFLLRKILNIIILYIYMHLIVCVFFYMKRLFKTPAISSIKLLP